MQWTETSDSSRLHPLPGAHVENGSQHSRINQDDSFLTGIKQRLLSFIFRGIWNEETDQTLVSPFTCYLHYLLGLKVFKKFIWYHFGILCWNLYNWRRYSVSRLFSYFYFKLICIID